MLGCRLLLGSGESHKYLLSWQGKIIPWEKIEHGRERDEGGHGSSERSEMKLYKLVLICVCMCV